MQKEPLDLLTISQALNSHQYKLGQNIGNGSSASAFRVFSKKYNQVFCAKIVYQIDFIQKSFYEAELHTLMSLDHPNIIRLYDTFSEGKFFYLILEYCSGGSLKDDITAKGPATRERLYSLTRSILESIDFCHQRGIAHRDIKPENFLLNEDGVLKLADFGFSRYVNFGMKFRQSCGSLPFLAPEIIHQYDADPYKADIWAAGVTLYYIAVGKVPWPIKNAQTICKAIISGDFKVPDYLPSTFANLIYSMLSKNPESRPSSSELLQYPYLIDGVKVHAPLTSTSLLNQFSNSGKLISLTSTFSSDSLCSLKSSSVQLGHKRQGNFKAVGSKITDFPQLKSASFHNSLYTFISPINE